MIFSYPNRTLLIISDPYVEGIGLWPIGSWLFRVGASLSGFQIIYEQINNQNTFATAVSKLDQDPEVTVVSPWNMDKITHETLNTSRIIIAGGNFTQENTVETTDKICKVEMDPRKALSKAGRMAGKMALDMQKPALILYQDNIEGVLEAYEKASNGKFPLNKIQLSNKTATLPKQFNTMAAESSVLLLFAGPLNINAFMATQNTQQPVITEFALIDGRWSNRIVASIENNNLAMVKAVLTAMLKKTPESVKFYSGRLKIRKKWFDLIRRTIL